MTTFLTVLVICITLCIFKHQIERLVNWATTIRRLSRSKDGYSLEASGTSSEGHLGVQDIAAIEFGGESLIEHKETSKTKWIALTMEKKFDEASKILKEDIAQAKTENERNLLEGGLGYVFISEDRKKGEAYFESLLQKPAPSFYLFYWYSISLFWIDDFSACIKVCERAIETINHPYFARLIGDCVRAQKGLEAAISTVKSLMPKFEKKGNLYCKIVEYLKALNRHDDALSTIKEGLRSDPQSETLLPVFYDELSERNDFEGAFLVVDKLLQINPKSPHYITLKGNALLALGYNDSALECYEEGRRLSDSKEGWILGNIGNILIQKGLYSRGLVDLRKGLEIEPESQYILERITHAVKQRDIEKENVSKIRERRNLSSLFD